MTGPQAIERARAALRGHQDIVLALLFGSMARGQSRVDSDIDIALLAPGADLLAIAAQLMDATGREVDVVSLDDATIPLLEELLRDGIVIHEGRPGAAARWRFHAALTLETDGPGYRRMRDAFLERLAASGAPRAGA